MTHTFRLLSLLLLLLPTGCQIFGPEPTPTALVETPAVRATATLILPTPPPGATLTAMVEAYRRTRTPSGVASPTDLPISFETREPTPTGTPTLIAGPSIYAVPELTEPGMLVEVRGAGWQPEEKIAIGLGITVEDARMTDAQGTAQGDGTFAATLAIPAEWTGEDAIVVAQSLDGRRRAVTRLYLVGPTAILSPTPSPTGTPLPPSPTPAPTATPTPSFQGWRGEYYDNPDLRGAPVHIRDDSIIDFYWGQGTPVAGVPADGFSVRWTREIDFLPGGYQFEVQVDDGVRVFIDDQLVLDEWKVTSTTSYDVQQVLEGPTDIRVEYFDAGGNAIIRFQWRYLGRYPNWRGAYYDNRSLLGSPVLVRNDIAVDFNWGTGSPAPQIPPDNFSARWTRTVSLESGTQRFHARADDGIRVWVDGRLIIDEWHISTGETDYTGDIYLSRGNHDVRIEYYEAGGKAEVYVWWENLDAHTGWRGAYYDNRYLSGPPAFVRNDPSIDFDWGQGGPDNVGPDNFSVQWTDRLSFFEAGVYRFHAEHDDGVRIWVDGRLVIDEWYDTGPVTHSGDVELSVGPHEVHVDYFEAAGSARIRVWWELAPYH